MPISRAWVWTWVCVWMALFAVSCGGEAETPAVPEGEAPPEGEAEAERAQTPAAGSELDGLEGFWETERADAILERTREFEVRADTSGLTEGERRAVGRLMEIGEIFHRLFEESRHAQATEVAAHLAALEVGEAERPRLEAMRRLYRLFEGPVAFTLEGVRVPFAPVRAYEPGRNVYPAGTEAEALEAWLAEHEDAAASVRATRTVVRRRDAETVAADRARLEAHPWIAALHPTIGETLDGDDAYYAVPYAMAYADALSRASRLLFASADDVRSGDADLADYFEARARDLLTNDYEAGDAAWVSGRFERLNAEVGAYETYDDHLLGQKAFHAVSILVRAPEASAELERAVAQLSDFEAALPGGPYERVRAEIPIGIYDVVADYGQARGGNTASILPNEAHITRKYGRTILIRRNVITHPVFVETAQARFRAAVAEPHADDLGPRGAFDRTVWHEVGHYLGPKTTEDGRVVTEALGNLHNHIEEMKADLVSLWLMPRLVEAGVIDADRMRHAYAAGVLRVLVTSEPPRSSPYRTMQLMQQNWLLERGALRFDPEAGRLHIDYARYPEAVEAMLTEVLRIQRAGDRAAAEAFVERWARWDDDVQGALGRALDEASPRYWLPSYAALEGDSMGGE